MKKLLILVVTFFVLVSCSQKSTINENSNSMSMPNPWTDCDTDLNKASEIAGFTFPLILSNYTVRAMKEMIEINYPLDEFRIVCVRKTNSQQYADNGDISGVYTEYPINKKITLDNGVPIKVRGTQDKIYVMNMSASNGYYSAYCKDGMSLKEVEEIYQVIAEAEAPKLP